MIRTSLAIAFLLLCGCWLVPGKPTGKPSMDPVCTSQIPLLLESCTSPYENQDAGQLMVLEHQHGSLASNCSAPAHQAELAKVTACIGELKTRLSQAEATAESQREQMQPQIAAVRADPSFLPAREAYSAARDDTRLDCREYENAALAERDYLLKKRVCERANKEEQAALEALHEIVRRHGIDPSDAKALQLW